MLRAGAKLSLPLSLPLSVAPAGALATNVSPSFPVRPLLGPESLAADADYWQSVADLYDITDEVAMLDNGYWGSMARPVVEAYERHTLCLLYTSPSPRDS